MAKSKSRGNSRGATRMRERGMKSVPVYLTPAEHKKFKEVADSKRMSLSLLFRRAFLATYPMH